MAKKQTVTEVYTPLAAFRTLNRDERNLLLTAAHATNEMGAILRLVMIAQNQPSIGPICDLYRDTQAFTLQKVLAGKLYECWKLVAARYFATGLGQFYDEKLLDHGKESLARLKRYFGRSTNIIALIRNDAAFHYSRHDVSACLDELTDDDCRVYLGNSKMHALYWVGEQPMRRHLLRQIDPDNNRALEIMSQDLSDVGRDMGTFLGCVVLALIRAAIHGQENKGRLRRCRLRETAYDPRTIKLPIFLDTSSDDALELEELLQRANHE
jgi:hypothetical protein